MISRDESPARRTGLALILALGFAVVFAMAALWVSNFFIRAPSLQGYEYLHVDAKGKPVIFRLVGNHWDAFALDGTPRKLTQDATFEGAALFLHAERIHVYEGSWSNRVVGFGDGAKPSALWYLFDDDPSIDGRGYFVGFDVMTRRRIGYIGRNGFSESCPVGDERFHLVGPGLAGCTAVMANEYDTGGDYTPDTIEQFRADIETPLWVRCFVADRKLLKIDFKTRTVVALVESPEIIDAARAQHPEPEMMRRGAISYETHAVLRHADRLVAFDPKDESRTDFLLPAELRDADFTAYPFPKEDECLVDVDDTQTGRHQLVWFDRQGTVTRREEVVLKKASAPPPWLDSLRAALCFPSPLLFSGISLLLVVQHGWVNASLAAIVSDNWPGAILALIVALGAMWLTARRARRFGEPLNAAWLTFVFVLGLPGYAGYVLHRRWPILEAAPAPQPTGCEVFA